MANLTAWLKIEGRQVPLIHYPPNWLYGPVQSFIFDTGIHSSTQMHEQRGTTRQEGELSHRLEITYTVEGRVECQRLYNIIAGSRGKAVVIPWWVEPMEDSTDRVGSDIFQPNVDLGLIKVITDEVIRVDFKNLDLFENQKVTELDYDTNTVRVRYPWRVAMDDPVYFFCRGVLLEAISRPHFNDGVHNIETVWGSVDDGLLP